MGLVDIIVFVGRFGNLEQSLTSVFSNYKDQSLTCKFVHGHDMDSKITWGEKATHQGMFGQQWKMYILRSGADRL